MSKKENSPLAKLKTTLTWLDQNLLLIFTGLLLGFIPLCPKIPLFDILPGYIVRVRAEDLLILIALITLFVQLLRKKVSLKTPLTRPILAYAATGLLSILSATLVIHTVPPELLHLGKTTLHYLRYLEYFSLFFIAYLAVKNKKDFKLLFGVMTLTLVGVVVYGFGQKYLHWPVYSTMNYEASKGMRLYLTEHARLQSTFAGHYDLGAWLVVVLPLILAAVYGLKNRLFKLSLTLVFWVGVWLLVVSAARTSFIAFSFAMFILILSFSLKQKSYLAKLKLFLGRSLYIYGLTLIIMLSFGHDLQERLAQVVESNQQIKIVLKSDQRPTTTKPKTTKSTLKVKKKPSDVYIKIPEKVTVATRSAEGKVVATTITKERTYSDNALKYGLSVAIRLDALWPQAIKGFLRNPITGSGYATLNKEGVHQFTKADSTDNNYLRVLGETGLLGFISFYGIIFYALLLSWRFIKRTKSQLAWSMTVGFAAATLGLLLNASYIDVFAASKVAMFYWATVGLMLKFFQLDKTSS